MNLMTSLLAALLAAAPQVELSTLKGEQQAGTLQALSASAVTLEKDGKTVEIPTAELLDLRFTAPAASSDGKSMQVHLVDGTHIGVANASAAVRDITFEAEHLGKFTLPLPAVSSLRFVSDADAGKVEQSWNELRARNPKGDLLVIRKGDILDFLEGTVGTIDDKTIKFLLDGDEIPVKREKVFGIVYGGRKPSNEKPVCEITLAGGDLLKVKSVTQDEGSFKAELLAGATVTLPADRLSLLDFSLGKVRYLSQIEPRDVEYTPFFDITWKYRRDRNLDGGPIQVGNKTYSRGLAIHSKTFLRYRIGGEYRRFQAVMGIDYELARRGMGDVHVVISGDGKPLFEGDVRGSDEPRILDLDVTGVRDLEILVDFGGDLDIADHLDLADAKVIK